MRRSLACVGLLSLLTVNGCEPQASEEKPLTSKDDSTISKPVAPDDYSSGITWYTIKDNSTISKPSVSEPQAYVEKPYTSQFGYTTQIDPRDFGMELKDPSSRRIGKFDIFSESFGRKPHAFLVNKLPLLSNDLETTFYTALSFNVEMNQSDLEPGQGFRMVGEGKPRPISIDGMDGLMGGSQLWRYNTRDDLLNDRYLDKRSIKLVVAADGTYSYTFTFISGDVNDNRFASVVEVYEKFATSFKRSN